MGGLLWWIIALAIAVVVFAVLGFGVLAGAAAWVLRILFIVFIIALIFMLVRNLASSRA